MRCIGVNQWAGVDQALADVLSALESQSKKSIYAGGVLRQTTPVEKFYLLANERYDRPTKYGVGPVEGFYRITDASLASITKVRLPDIVGAGAFIVQLQSVYVVDMARGMGQGKQAIESVKEIAEESGCCVTLFARSFGFSRNGTVPYAMESFADLWKASVEEEWPIVYPPAWDIESLRRFYSDCGFRNMCLYDAQVFERPKANDLPFESQFVYTPTSLNPELHERLTHRLNKDMCEFCNR
jgi:hypothetical protein